jgi:hypothetical protein
LTASREVKPAGLSMLSTPNMEIEGWTLEVGSFRFESAERARGLLGREEIQDTGRHGE